MLDNTIAVKTFLRMKVEQDLFAGSAVVWGNASGIIGQAYEGTLHRSSKKK